MRSRICAALIHGQASAAPLTFSITVPRDLSPGKIGPRDWSGVTLNTRLVFCKFKVIGIVKHCLSLYLHVTNILRHYFNERCMKSREILIGTFYSIELALRPASSF